MITLQNSATTVSVYVGGYVSDKIDSDFTAHSKLTVDYSDFMAWMYQHCNVVIGCGDVVNFTISDSALNTSINSCLDNIDENLKFELVRI